MENHSNAKILPKCQHRPDGKECGEFLQVGSVVCPKCDGKICPCCSASVVKEQKLCCACGFDLFALEPLQTGQFLMLLVWIYENFSSECVHLAQESPLSCQQNVKKCQSFYFKIKLNLHRIKFIIGGKKWSFMNELFRKDHDNTKKGNKIFKQKIDRVPKCYLCHAITANVRVK